MVYESSDVIGKKRITLKKNGAFTNDRFNSNGSGSFLSIWLAINRSVN